MKIILKSFDLYTDGGVILKNPSLIGGTYAYVLIQDDKIKAQDSGVYTPEDMETSGVGVTNNQTELLAILSGVEWAQSKGWHIRCLYSDSQVTLGRLYQGWSLKNIPYWMVQWKNELAHVIQTIPYQLVKGHADNVWNNKCDELCQEAAKTFLLKGNYQ
jgi:ribonuclease HI